MVARFAYDDGNPAQSGLHRRAPTPLTSNQFKAVALGSNDQRLNYSLVANRGGELFDFRFVKCTPGLKRTRSYPVNSDFKGRALVASLEIGFRRARNECAQASTQALFLRRHCW